MSDLPTTSDEVVTVKNITPQLARRLMKRNTMNRPFRRAHVAYLADVIRRGEWTLNNDALMIGSNGVLLNGQHRLSAVVESNKTVRMLVMYNVDPATYKHIDNGLHRSTSDLTGLTPQMASDCTMLATIMRMRQGGQGRIGKASADQVLAEAVWWRPAHDALHEIASKAVAPGLVNTPMRVAFGLRWAISPPEQAAHVLLQYGCMLRNDTQHMDTAIATLWRRMAEKRRAGEGGRDARLNMAARIYYHNDLARSDRNPAIRDFGDFRRKFMLDIEAMRRAFNGADGNPVYDWSRPEVHSVTSEALFPGASRQTRAVGGQRRDDTIPMAADRG